MHGQYDADFHGAIIPQDSLGGGGGQFCPKIPSHANLADRKMWLALMARALWGVTAPAALFDLVGQQLGYEDDRQCRRWARGETTPDVPVLWLLLRSREGYRVLNFIMDHEPPDWWIAHKRDRELAALAIEIFKRVSAIERGAP